MQGFTKILQTPSDLFDKLKYDFSRLEQEPGDVYAAFDFFVTAEQMPDWIDDKDIRKEHDILKVLSHVANSAKHFRVTRPRHKHAIYNTYCSTEAVNNSEIRIQVNPDNGYCKGEYIDAVSFAKDILDFWAKQLETSG